MHAAYLKIFYMSPYATVQKGGVIGLNGADFDSTPYEILSWYNFRLITFILAKNIIHT